MTVSDGATELYYLNYLFGFLASGLLYWALHLIFPDEKSDEFVRNSQDAKTLQQLYHTRWDVTLAETWDLLNEPAVVTLTEAGKEPAAAEGGKEPAVTVGVPKGSQTA